MHLLVYMTQVEPHVWCWWLKKCQSCNRGCRTISFNWQLFGTRPKFLTEAIPSSKRERKEQKERQKEEKWLTKEQGNAKGKTCVKTPLEIIVPYNQLDLIMHPIFQRLLLAKWNLFVKRGSWALVLFNLFYTLIWTFLRIFIPRGE